MADFDLLLADRIGVIKDIVNKYGEDKFYLSFSGGKDSTVLHYLLDLALPNNKIKRVFINTGIEYFDTINFVHELMKKDSRFEEIRPSMPIKKVLETYGYPFKSKEHSTKVGAYQKGSRAPSTMKYKQGGDFGCPKVLLYQFEDDFKIKLSPMCCTKLKKEPVHKAYPNHIAILGVRMEEGGQRKNQKGCFNSKRKIFKPLNVVNNEFIEEFIKRYNVQLNPLYEFPYFFQRTGCKGCPFAIDLREELNKMPEQDYKHACFIFGDIYKEYKRIHYRGFTDDLD